MWIKHIHSNRVFFLHRRGRMWSSSWGRSWRCVLSTTWRRPPATPPVAAGLAAPGLAALCSPHSPARPGTGSVLPSASKGQRSFKSMQEQMISQITLGPRTARINYNLSHIILLTVWAPRTICERPSSVLQTRWNMKQNFKHLKTWNFKQKDTINSE